MMIKNLSILALVFFVSSCTVSKDIEVAKLTNPQAISTQSLIYSLPQTGITISLDVIKTSVSKGIYADYALKYLNMTNVPMADRETYAISNVVIEANSVPDPSQYYSVTYKTYPDNLNRLLSVSDHGIVLDFANAWKGETSLIFPSAKKSDMIGDPYLLKETLREKVDTFYKTVMTDSTIVKIPVIKKQTLVKTIDDFAKEAAVNLIKTRKRKLKMLRGEYEFHPDGEALKVMIELLTRQEQHFYALFAGERRTETLHYAYPFVPQPEKMSIELCYFSTKKGVQDSSIPGASLVSVQLSKQQEPVRGVVPQKDKNVLFVRIPVRTLVSVKVKNDNVAVKSLPVYQFGAIQVFPIQ